MAQTTKELFKGIYQMFLCHSVFFLQNTNICISSIINENPPTFQLMQRFEMTVIKNACFVQNLYSSDWKLHVHMKNTSLTLLIIQAAPQGSISIPDTGVTSITFLTHVVFYISDIFVSFTFLEGHLSMMSFLQDAFINYAPRIGK